MLSRLKAYFLGEKLAQNDLGWRIEGYKKGLVVRGPVNAWRNWSPFGPFLVNLAFVAGYFISKSDKLFATILALPLTMLMGFCFFRAAVLYLHREKRTAMLGNFSRFSFSEIIFDSKIQEVSSVQLISTKLSEPKTVWTSSSEAEVQMIRGLLMREIRPISDPSVLGCIEPNSR